MRQLLDGVVPPILVIAAFVLLLPLRSYLARGGRRHQIIADAAVTTIVVCLTGLLALAMGRPLTYRNGPAKLWHGEIHSDQNSQQIADPYTFTHVIHGAALYGLTHLVMPATSIGLRASLALTLEAAWEAYENTDTVIRRYRSATIALGYYGDSVINSVADILACLIGFLLATRFRWWVTLSWVAITEIVLALTIRDNLTLNIVMLLYPIKAIREWQLGG